MTEIACMLMYDAGLPPDYVMDRLQPWEIDPLLKYSYMRIRPGWEQARLCAYITAQANSTKRLTPSSIVGFPWDDEDDNEEHDTRMSNEDLQRLRKEAKEFINGRSCN